MKTIEIWGTKTFKTSLEVDDRVYAAICAAGERQDHSAICDLLAKTDYTTHDDRVKLKRIEVDLYTEDDHPIAQDLETY